MKFREITTLQGWEWLKEGDAFAAPNPHTPDKWAYYRFDKRSVGEEADFYGHLDFLGASDDGCCPGNIKFPCGTILEHERFIPTWAYPSVHPRDFTGEPIPRYQCICDREYDPETGTTITTKTVVEKY